MKKLEVERESEGEMDGGGGDWDEDNKERGAALKGEHWTKGARVEDGERKRTNRRDTQKMRRKQVDGEIKEIKRANCVDDKKASEESEQRRRREKNRIREWNECIYINFCQRIEIRITSHVTSITWLSKIEMRSLVRIRKIFHASFSVCRCVVVVVAGIIKIRTALCESWQKLIDSI